MYCPWGIAGGPGVPFVSHWCWWGSVGVFLPVEENSCWSQLPGSASMGSFCGVVLMQGVEACGPSPLVLSLLNCFLGFVWCRFSMWHMELFWLC